MASTNPILFKIKYINGEVIDTPFSPTMLVGSAFHLAMQTYYGGNDEYPVTSEAEGIEYGLQAGYAYIKEYEPLVEFTKSIPDAKTVQKKFVYAFESYIKEVPYEPKTLVSTEEQLNEAVQVNWKGTEYILPVPLKGYTDKLVEEKGKLYVVDYKTCASFSNPDKIDGAKIIQAVIYYLLVYAKHGRAPYAMRFEEVKTTANRDNSPQVRKYEIVYKDNPLFFDCFFRFYYDVINAVNGQMVWLPNLDALWNNDIALTAYINNLDVDTYKKPTPSTMTITDKIKAIELHIANAANLEVKELYERSRTQNIADARAAVWYLLRERLGLSYLKIGAMYQRDHSTIVRAVQRAKRSRIASTAQAVIEAKDATLLRKTKDKGTLSVDKWQY